jgi:hypothetical protein
MFYFVAEIPNNNPNSMKLVVPPTTDRAAAVDMYQDMAFGAGQKKASKGATLAIGTLDFTRTHRQSTATPVVKALDKTPTVKA